MTLTDLLEVLILNARNRAATYESLTREAIEISPDCDQVQSKIWSIEQAEVFNLAERIKDRFEFIINDIRLLIDPLFPKTRGQEDDDHEERTVIVQALARSAFEDVDFSEMARTFISRVKEGGLP